jgi:hypothetical protein
VKLVGDFAVAVAAVVTAIDVGDILYSGDLVKGPNG